MQYPEFCWKEVIVNAIAHRDYSILGTDIQVKLFDDHMTVESPGILPGLVRTYNIREMHFSRNPRIAQYMRAYKLVKEFGEGVDRMFREMDEAACPAPEYRQNEFMVYATLRQHHTNGELNGTLNGTQQMVYDKIKEQPGIQAQTIIAKHGIPRDTLNKVLKTLMVLHLIERRGSKKTGGYYAV